MIIEHPLYKWRLQVEIHLYNDKGFSIAMFDEMGMEYKGVYMPCSSSIVEFTSLQVRKLFCTWRL
jgi:hypothetical protein